MSRPGKASEIFLKTPGGELMSLLGSRKVRWIERIEAGISDFNFIFAQTICLAPSRVKLTSQLELERIIISPWPRLRGMAARFVRPGGSSGVFPAFTVPLRRYLSPRNAF
jgi:hypothetical protein